MDNIKLEQDLLLGNLNEDYIKDVLCEHFKFFDLLKLDKFHPFDFKSLDTGELFEVKSRRFNHNKYNTTMIGYNKVDYIRKYSIKTAYFVFVFEDGNYYYKFNPDDKFETCIGGRSDRGISEYKKYYYIPINKLIKII